MSTGEFHTCSVCRAMVTGPHACSPLAVGNIRFEPRESLTEEDVRRIVREEIAAARNGER